MSSCSFLLYLLTQTNYSATHSRTAVNWLRAPRCLRQMKWRSEQEETTSVATRSSSSVAPYHSFPPLAKTHSLRTSSSPQNASILGHPLQGDYISDRRLIGSSPTGSKNKKSCQKTGFFALHYSIFVIR